MTVEAVCFDLDDTLYDYLRYADAGLEEAGDCIEALTGRQYHAELYDLYFEEGVTEGTFDALIEQYDLRPEFVDDMIAAYHAATGPLEPYPETEAVLAELVEEYRLGCITDGREGHTKLRRLGIRERFEEVLVTPNVGRSKDDPDVFRHVLAAISVPPAAAVYVGDDPRADFRAPNGLGMTTVRVRRGRYTDIEPADEAAVPDYEVRDLDGVVDVLSTVDRVDQNTPAER